MKHEACYVLRQGQITFVLASPLERPSSRSAPAGAARRRSPVHRAGSRGRRRGVRGGRGAGAQPASPPRTVEDEHGAIDLAEIHAYGDTTHTLLNRSRYRGVFAPGFQPLDPERYSPRTFHPVGLKAIDHIVANVEEGKMGDWVDYYSKVMGFSLMASFDDKDISTEYSALMSRVVADGRGRIKFPINEPAKSRRRSQIDEFLEYYGGPGVQHIALATGDIIASVRAMAANDVSFLRVPPAYYEMLPERVGTIREDLRELAELGILVDRDDEGYLLQIFTKPVEDRPTLFFEVIQRRGRRALARGTSRPCSRPSSASRRAGERFDSRRCSSGETRKRRCEVSTITKRLSVDQYDQMVENGILPETNRFELINGKLVEKNDQEANALGRHRSFACERSRPATTRLAGMFGRSSPSASPTGEASRSRTCPWPVAASGLRDRHPGPADVALVVEVTRSSVAKDRKLARVYGPGGIPVYWIVNIRGRQLEVYDGPDRRPVPSSADPERDGVG